MSKDFSKLGFMIADLQTQFKSAESQVLIMQGQLLAIEDEIARLKGPEPKPSDYSGFPEDDLPPPKDPV